jgi:glucan phosphoethanolaminetransferase (alkaline phosphatase superfamily)
MNTELVGSAITILILLATMVEAALEMCKPAFTKITDEKWRTSITILASVIIGVILAFLFQFNLLTYLPFLLLPAWAGFVFMGMLSAAGSRFWHSILDLVIKLTAMAQAKVTEIQTKSNA